MAPFTLEHARKLVGIAGIVLIVLNFFFFLLNLYNEVVFWAVIILVLVIAFPLMNYLKKVKR